MMEINAKQFKTLETKWARYIHVMSNRFSMEPGDRGELYNDGLVVLYETAQEFSPETTDFHKMFKTKLGHNFSDYVRSCKAKKRSVYSKTALEFPRKDGLRMTDVNGGLHNAVIDQWVSAFLDLYEQRDYVENFISNLSDEEQSILKELIDPSEQTLILFESRTYSRVPKSVPLAVIAKSLGIPEKRVKVTRRRLQKKLMNYYSQN